MDPTEVGEWHGCSVDPTPRWKRRLRELRWRVAFNVKIHTYHRFIYRPHMKLIHRFGRHQWTRIGIGQAPGHNWCQWCGERKPQ